MHIPSVMIAKDRLKTLLTSDRIQCAPDMTEQMTKEVYRVLSKYIEIKPEDFDMTVNRDDIYIRFTGEKH